MYFFDVRHSKLMVYEVPVRREFLIPNLHLQEQTQNFFDHRVAVQ